jgi:hypothetical protein
MHICVECGLLCCAHEGVCKSCVCTFCEGSEQAVHLRAHGGQGFVQGRVRIVLRSEGLVNRGCEEQSGACPGERRVCWGVSCCCMQRW